MIRRKRRESESAAARSGARGDVTAAYLISKSKDHNSETDGQISTDAQSLFTGPMGCEECRCCPEEGRKRRCCILSLVAVVLLIIAVAVSVTLSTVKRQDNFISKCKAFKGYDCDQLWKSFQQAYIGRDPCNVPVEAYDPFIALVMEHFKPECNRMMFWSKTKDLAHAFAKKNRYVTLEDTLLGSVVDGLTWCGKEGSSETFTTGCPGWDNCTNNPVRSYWNRASTAFADAACGDVRVMLNGSISTPFHPSSIFASIEVKRITFPRVASLNVILVIQKNFVTDCRDASLTELQKELDPRIKYNCKEMAET